MNAPACEPALKPIAASRALGGREVDEPVGGLVANRADLRLRNRLVEHYFPWFTAWPARSPGRDAFSRPENAVGEMLAALVKHIVPSYDGQAVRAWARLCQRRKLVDQKRVERTWNRALRRSCPAPRTGGSPCWRWSSHRISRSAT